MDPRTPEQISTVYQQLLEVITRIEEMLKRANEEANQLEADYERIVGEPIPHDVFDDEPPRELGRLAAIGQPVRHEYAPIVGFTLGEEQWPAEDAEEVAEQLRAVTYVTE